jgi:hypothetical protein
MTISGQRRIHAHDTGAVCLLDWSGVGSAGSYDPHPLVKQQRWTSGRI